MLEVVTSSSICGLLNGSHFLHSFLKLGRTSFSVIIAESSSPPAVAIVAISQIAAQYSGPRSLVLAFPRVCRAPDILRPPDDNMPKPLMHWMPHWLNIEVIQNRSYIISNGMLELWRC